MTVLYRQTASDDIVRQFRYYLLTAEAPEIALRFREAVRRTIQSIGQNPQSLTADSVAFLVPVPNLLPGLCAKITTEIHDGSA